MAEYQSAKMSKLQMMAKTGRAQDVL